MAHPTRPATTGVGLMADAASRSPTRPTRGWPTTATCATSRCASTSRPSTGCSWPRGRRSSGARSRPGTHPRSFLMAPRWLDGLADVLDASDAPCFVVSESLAEQVTGFHVHRGALASLRRTPLPVGRLGARRRAVGPGARGRRRPHQRRRDLPQRRRPRLRRRAAVAAVRRPAVPPVDQGRAWARSSRCPGPGCPRGRPRWPTLSAAGFTTVALTLGARRRRRGGRRPRPRQGRPRPRRRGPRPLVALGGSPPTAAPSSPWPPASTPSTSPPRPPSPATSRRDADDWSQTPPLRPVSMAFGTKRHRLRASRSGSRRSARGRPPRPTARRCGSRPNECERAREGSLSGEMVVRKTLTAGSAYARSSSSWNAARA